MKVTYLLGAGASYKAVPIVGELNDALLEIKTLCEQYASKKSQNTTAEIQPMVFRAMDYVNKHVTKGVSEARIYGTIDTYAKKLALTNNRDLESLKEVLGFFFTIWQEIEKDKLKGRINREDLRNNIKYQDIDDRYFGLIANYLIQKNSTIVLDENINFITWNYDTQLERAISTFTNSNLNQVLSRFKVYPFNQKENPQILHLNGIAGIYKNDRSIETLFKDPDSGIEDIFDNLLNLNHPKKSTSNDVFTYAWEVDPISMKAIEYSQEILKETNVLVIIGYSFPTFNDAVDKKLFECLNKSENFTKVYFQDPNASVELLNARFGIPEDKIKIVTNTNQFILPLDAQNYKADKQVEKKPTFVVH